MRRKMLTVCLAVGVGLLMTTTMLAETLAERSCGFGDGDVAPPEAVATGKIEVGENALAPLGNRFAPNAKAALKHNTSGPVLAFELKAVKLVPDKEYQVRYGETVLGTVKADEAGQAYLVTKVDDAQVLQAMSADAGRKLDLWQGSHRLARSDDVFAFAYEK